MQLKSQSAPVAIAACVGLLVVGCGRSSFETPTTITNSPPPVKLAEFARVELKPVTYDPSVLEDEDEAEVMKVAGRISELVQDKVQYFLEAWNKDTQRQRTHGPLTIEPIITQLKWVTRGERIWAGAMYGNSAIVIKLKMTERTSGSVVYEPIVFTRAVAMNGAWGTQEDGMLNAISDRVAIFLITNYETALGGPTGVETPAK